MKKILVTGALGQIGMELILYLRNIYGDNNVIASDLTFREDRVKMIGNGPFEILDVSDGKKIYKIAKDYNVDTMVHLAALLSAVAEKDPVKAWNINMGGTFNTLEVARELKTAYFTPSSIGAFGSNTPKVNTPQDTIQRPETMYGVTKVSGELLCDYYFKKFNVDTRGVRFPGLISYAAEPGGGTTDYAVDIYYEAIKNKKYSCFLKEGTYLDMMYMPDALKAIVDLMEADPSKLKHRNSFNITAMSIDPNMIYNEIKKHIVDFKMEYNVDPVRQEIADSWPDSIDSTCAREEWGFKCEYDLSKMTVDMLLKLKEKLGNYSFV